MSDSFIIFGSPEIQQSDIDAVTRVLESNWLGTGPKVAEFEAKFAEYKSVDSKQMAAVNSCTAALHLSLIAAGLGQGDEVITTPLTFCATVNAIIHSGATPVLADIDPSTLNIDPKEIEKKITSRTKAIIPVHFAGRPCEMKLIQEIANRYQLKIIEDCAHAVETEYLGQKAGTFGDFACFSFYVTKNITTGEGGMVLAKKLEDINRIKVLALHGMSKDAWKRYGDSGYKHYQVVECGFKYNMMDIQAALGISQLSRIETNWLKRKELWQRYQEAFKGSPVMTPAEPDETMRHAYHLYTLVIDSDQSVLSRDQFLDEMTSHGIGVGVHYMSIAEHPYYQDRFSWSPQDYPCATKVGRNIVSLPLSAKISDVESERIIKVVKTLLQFK